MTAGDAAAAANSATAGGRPIDRVVRDLVHRNQARLFPEAAAVEIIDVALGPPRHPRWGSYHRGVIVRYRNGGEAAALRLWLKFRPGLDALFPTLDAYDRRLDLPVFPRPYFAGGPCGDEPAFLATAHIDGVLLRDRLLRLAVLRQTRRLVPIFHSNGAKMRAFHDAFGAEQSLPVSHVVEVLTTAARHAAGLSAADRDAVAGHIGRAAERLAVDALPAIRTHDDWVLRNILVGADGTDCVIDSGGLQGRPKWRWYDIGLLLLNLDFQLKWMPLTTRPMLAALWSAFWQGYVGDKGVPDGLSEAQTKAALYLVRVHWLLDGVVRQPYLDVVADAGRLNRRLARRLTGSLTAGRCAVLNFP